MKTTEIPVFCWQCGKRFYIEISNVVAGHLFCSDECRTEDEKEKDYFENKKGVLNEYEGNSD